MSVSRSDVTQIAQLARLSIANEALDDVTDRFSRILTLVDQLQQVPTDGIEPMSNPHDMTQRLRADEVTEINQRDMLQAVAPEVHQGYFLVPRVID
jgi:aspartyl-tRNA(Asn)/glutamyl-tRNA(Gln) amidotransferase subunit C